MKEPVLVRREGRCEAGQFVGVDLSQRLSVDSSACFWGASREKEQIRRVGKPIRTRRLQPWRIIE